MDLLTPSLEHRDPRYADLAQRRVGAHQAAPREHFAPLWLLASLVLATLAALVFLYPKTYILQTLRANPQPTLATLAYLRLMVSEEPTAADTRILLAQEALAAGDWPLARYALSPWLNEKPAAMPPAVGSIWLRLQQAELGGAHTLAARRNALSKEHVQDLLALAPRMAPSALLHEIHFVASLGHYRTSARLCALLIRRTRNTALRQAAFDSGIKALLASGDPAAALAFAQADLPLMPPSHALWREMTGLALEAGNPGIAAQYAHHLVKLPPS
ncbi:MAG: hypothetical protein M0T84_12055 [Betaproteobacteria bacterium]|nr:hypothetical protein [Betaproteobacteria bacterium]